MGLSQLKSDKALPLRSNREKSFKDIPYEKGVRSLLSSLVTKSWERGDVFTTDIQRTMASIYMEILYR